MTVPAPTLSRPVRAGFFLVLGLAVACSTGTQTALAPADRAVHLAVDGCGVSSDTSGSGFVFDDGLVLTTAHLLIRAGGVEVTYPDGSRATAEVLAIDTLRDLAALTVPVIDVDRALIGKAEAGDTGFVVGGSTSGTVDLVVRQYASLSIEEVLGTERSGRRGYEIEAATADGDSGAGVYDQEGRLLGMVFAVTAGGGSTWVTASEEIDQFVSQVDRSGMPYICDPETSRVASQ